MSGETSAVREALAVYAPEVPKTERTPTGYKQTEVGTIPEEWEVERLASLGSGSIPPIKAGPFGSTLTKNLYVSAGYKVYGQEQVIRGDYLYGDYFVSFAKFKELENCSVKPGDVLLSLVGTAGKLLVVPRDAPKGIINPRLIRFSFDKKRVDSAFFKTLFETDQVQSYLKQYAQGGTMGVLNAGILRAVSIPLPPLHEQRAIAAMLSDMDDLISALDKLIAKKRAVRTAAMQQLLTGKRRLPGFEREQGYKSTSVGSIPKDWRIKAISDVAEVKTGPFGSSLHERDYVEHGTPIITVEHLSELGIVHKDLPFVSNSDKLRLKNYSLRQNDIVFSRVGSIDRNSLVGDAEEGWLFSGRLLRVRINGCSVHAPYLSYHFHSESFKKRVRDVAVGQTMPSLNTQILKAVRIAIPNLRASVNREGLSV